MDVNYINPFIKATLHTFNTMFKVTVIPERPVLKVEPFPTYDISGIIGLSRDAKGSITLSFPKAVALKVASKLIESEIKIVDADVCDAIGELTNIIAGNAKKDLKDLKVLISLPTVVMGKDHQLSNPRDVQSILIPFSSEMGAFALEVSLKTV